MDGLTKPEDIDGDKAAESAIDSELVAEPAANDQPVIPRIEPGLPPGPGAVLRAERETRGYSLDDVANALKLAPRQVEAIEADDFDALRGQTFARGFVKNYARLLGLDPDPLVARIRSSAPPTRVVLEPRSNANAEIPLSGGSQGPVVAGGLAVAALVVVAVVGTYGQWLGGDPKSREADTAAPNKANVTLSQTAGMSAPPQASPLSSTLSASAAAPTVSGAEQTVVATIPAAVMPAPGTGAAVGTASAVASPAAATAPAMNASSATAMSGKQPVAATSATAGGKPVAALSATPTTVAAATVSSATSATAAPKPAVAKSSGTVMTFSTPKPANSGETANPSPSSGVAITKSGELAMTTLVPRPVRNDKRMVLSFDEDAWVEVKDADGKVVFSQLSPAGASRTVEGKAPLSFVVGNAHHVKLKVDDKPFDIKPHIGVTVARFAVQ